MNIISMILQKRRSYIAEKTLKYYRVNNHRKSNGALTVVCGILLTFKTYISSF